MHKGPTAVRVHTGRKFVEFHTALERFLMDEDFAVLGLGFTSSGHSMSSLRVF